MKVPYFVLGAIVTLKASFMDEPIGTKCYVYEHYGNEGGISIISENGKDIGGFSLDEQAEYLEFHHDTRKVYHFKNVMQLYADWRAGVFKEFFNQ